MLKGVPGCVECLQIWASAADKSSIGDAVCSCLLEKVISVTPGCLQQLNSLRCASCGWEVPHA